MNREIKTTLALDGEKAFREAMSEAAREMRVLNSEMKASTASFAGHEDSSEALTAKSRILNSQIEQQKAIVAALAQAVEDAAKKYGDADQKTDGYRIQLNNARAALSRMEGDLGTTTSSLNSFGTEMGQEETKAEHLHGALSKVGEGLKHIGTVAGQAAVAGIKAIGAATAAAAAAAAKLGADAIKSAGEVQKFSDVTGQSAERVQELSYVGKQIDMDFETLMKSQTKLTQGMSQANKAYDDMYAYSEKCAAGVQDLVDRHASYDEVLKALEKTTDISADKQKKLAKDLLSGKVAAVDVIDAFQKGLPKLNDQAKAFETLGINIYDSSGQLRDSKVVMMEAIDALGSISNETERDALSLQIFGKSAMELNPLIKTGSAEIARLSEEARKVGAVMSNETVAGLDEFGDSTEALKMSVTGLAGTALSSLMPALKGTVGQLQGLAVAAGAALRTGDWKEFAKQAGQAVKTLVEQITTMLPAFIEIGTEIITTLITALVEAIPVVLPKLVAGLNDLIFSIIILFYEQGPALIQTALDAVGTLVLGLIEALPYLVDTAIQLVLALVEGITRQLPALIPAAVDAVITIVDVLVNNLPMLIDAAIQLILALVEGLIQALPRIVQAMPKLIKGMVDGLIGALPKLIDAAVQIVVMLVEYLLDNLPMLIGAAIEIIGALAVGLIDAIPRLIETVPKLFKALADKFKDTDWASVGKSIIDGIVEGIKKVAANIGKAAKDAAGDALAAVKQLLGIRSPSTVMRDQVGMQIGAGMAEGIAGSAGNVQAAMGRLNQHLVTTARATLSISGATGKASGGGLGGITININGSIRSADDARTMARELDRLVAIRTRASGGAYA